MTTTKTATKKNIIILASAIIAISLGYSLIGTEPEIAIVKNTESSFKSNPSNQLTVADVWKIENNTANSDANLNENINQTEDTQKKERTYSLDYTMLHKEIGKIRLTEDGNIIVDDIALKALERAFPKNRLNHTPEMMEEMLAIIKQGLPGKAGEQAADIIQKFFEFAKAKKELDSVYGDVNLAPSNREEALEENKALRRLYLGEELATQLFDKSDKESGFMHDTLEIARNKEMSQEEKEKAKNKLSLEYLGSVLTNWDSRYQAYQSASTSIQQNQSLDSDEIKHALIELQKESFTIEELKTIRRANIRL